MREGGDLLLVSRPDHSWWKNLRGGEPVTLRIRWRLREGVAGAIEGGPAANGLLARIDRGNILVRVHNPTDVRR